MTPMRVVLLLATLLVAAEPQTWKLVVPIGKKSLVIDIADGSTRTLDRPWRKPPAERPRTAKGGVKLSIETNRAIWRLMIERPGAKRREPVPHAAGDCREVTAHESHGFVVFTVETTSRRPTKATPRNVVHLDLATRKRTVLHRAVHFHDFAFSPDGKWIAISHGTRLDFHAAATGRVVRSFVFEEIDPRFHYHHASHLLWHPDSTLVACAIPFLGGRLAGPGDESKPMYGDEHVFLLPREGKLRALRIPERAWPRPVAWRR